jgi:transposase-like protein
MRKMTPTKTFEEQPCACGSIEYNRVEGSVDEESGWECASCGKNFIADETQQQVDYESLPQSIRDSLYVDTD